MMARATDIFSKTETQDSIGILLRMIDVVQD